MLDVSRLAHRPEQTAGRMNTPVLPGLFTPILSERVNAERDQAIQQVTQHAEDHRPGFSDEAATFVVHHLRANGPTSSEQLSIACKDAGIVPHDDRAFGSVYKTLATRGVITKVGTVRRERGHGTSGGTVWGLVS